MEAETETRKPHFVYELYRVQKFSADVLISIHKSRADSSEHKHYLKQLHPDFNGRPAIYRIRAKMVR